MQLRAQRRFRIMCGCLPCCSQNPKLLSSFLSPNCLLPDQEYKQALRQQLEVLPVAWDCRKAAADQHGEFSKHKSASRWSPWWQGSS